MFNILLSERLQKAVESIKPAPLTLSNDTTIKIHHSAIEKYDYQPNEIYRISGNDVEVAFSDPLESKTKKLLTLPFVLVWRLVYFEYNFAVYKAELIDTNFRKHSEWDNFWSSYCHLINRELNLDNSGSFERQILLPEVVMELPPQPWQLNQKTYCCFLSEAEFLISAYIKTLQNVQMRIDMTKSTK